MDQQLAQVRTAAVTEISTAEDEAAVEAARIKYLGQSGILTGFSKRMKELSKEEKPRVGKLLNEARSAVTAALEAKRKAA